LASSIGLTLRGKLAVLQEAMFYNLGAFKNLSHSNTWPNYALHASRSDGSLIALKVNPEAAVIELVHRQA